MSISDNGENLLGEETIFPPSIFPPSDQSGDQNQLPTSGLRRWLTVRVRAATTASAQPPQLQQTAGIATPAHKVEQLPFSPDKRDANGLPVRIEPQPE